ncbi:GH36-type glycosyl hydrolase domain-containing protein [Rheinheimera sp. NSM]|uniref:GH36-type glycosyl hydrolase domain-containing protein n=1 Tax=Rheinheimera sp. NSM TaxID=3457884 RepID=UPI004035BE61
MSVSVLLFFRTTYRTFCRFISGRLLTPLTKLRLGADSWFSAELWQQTRPVRAELFSVERLQLHAQSLATAQPVVSDTTLLQQLRQYCRPALQRRLTANADTLLAAYRVSAAELQAGHNIVPAAEWLLDNYHIVEQQIREIRDDLPPGYYRQLPKLARGPFRGYPRVLGIAWAYIAHTDSHFDPVILQRFLSAYQQVQPLSIGELWAVAITLRIVLIENLRRLTDQISLGLRERAAADQLADALLNGADWQHAVAHYSSTLTDNFAAQLAKRLRDQDPGVTPALSWLNRQLSAQHDNIDDVVLRAQQRLGASNVSVRNVITSMRLMSAIDWTELFESVSLVDQQLAGGSRFSEMDFASRNLYRTAIEQLARRAKCSELTVTTAVLQTAHSAATGCDNPVQAAREADCGYHLLGNGRPAFAQQLGITHSTGYRLRHGISSRGIKGYISLFILLSAALLLLAGALLDVSAAGWLWLLLLAAIPLSELAGALLQNMTNRYSTARVLPALALQHGVPPELRTLIAVPVLLSDATELRQHLQRLEEHYLAAGNGDISLALLSDFADAPLQQLPTDKALLQQAIAGIAGLNSHYGAGPAGPRFLLLHRQRTYNPGELCWMGRERKRGKLSDLNAALRSNADAAGNNGGPNPFSGASAEYPLLSNAVPPQVRYVITLDADTRLPRNAAVKLVGKMAHPLNQAQFCPQQQRIIAGYGILQPRVTPALALAEQGSRYLRLSSGPAGIDPYAGAVSDLYQDLFAEGSFTGKGIYDVDAFSAALSGRVPDNSMLSHDLFEGIFARAGLASDIEVVEDFPSRYDVAVKRQHRWTRGDWQLLPWLYRATVDRAPVNRHGAATAKLPLLGCWKILDNLRRSLLAPAGFVALTAALLLPWPTALNATWLLLAVLLLPVLLMRRFSVLPRHSILQHGGAIQLRSLYGNLLADLGQTLSQSLLQLILLADQAWRMSHAISVTLWRLLVSRKHLLQWVTTAQNSAKRPLSLAGYYRQMAPGLILAWLSSALVLWLAPHNLPLLLPLLLLWQLAPALMYWLSLPTNLRQTQPLSGADADSLRLVARRTWRFFERFVSSDDNWLPPDNFQQLPQPVVAHRTSPTNIGMYLLSIVTARDFGWLGSHAAAGKLEQTFVTLAQLGRHQGHFFNWYDTQTLQPLAPAYISSVDSGNLAGHLLALANSVEDWQQHLSAPLALQGLNDTLALAQLSLQLCDHSLLHNRQLRSKLDKISQLLHATHRPAPLHKALIQLAAEAHAEYQSAAAQQPAGVTEQAHCDNLQFYLQALLHTLQQHQHDNLADAAAQQQLRQRFANLAADSRALALQMNFAFLLNTERNLLSIGYTVADNQLDSSCYDLLASEARLASLFAIAKGDIDSKHWFRLGRGATPLGKGAALLSWSGSMFEYLMPSLVMRAAAGSLLEQSNRLIVARQIQYGRQHNIPWGISESAYNARDLHLTYQYSNFGVPGLGLKRGLAQNLVIAPYATALAGMVDAPAACRNFARLEQLGALGDYGFFEALDYTPSRSPDPGQPVLVQSFMAHHQGMTLVAVLNTLQQGLMRSRFHREPMISACELLLQERVPRDVLNAHPRAEAVTTAAGSSESLIELSPDPAAAGAPHTHILSNGHYSVMLSAAGSGYSHWRGVAITRWRADSSLDNCGSYILLRERNSKQFYATSLQPCALSQPATSAAPPSGHAVTFSEEAAEFSMQFGEQQQISARLTVVVSSEHNGEVRCVTLCNHSRRGQELELTSYAELVLGNAAADNAHPAFAKLFVQTEFVSECGAIIATRRPRTPHETPLWLAHFAVVEGGSSTALQYETDRAQFFGSGTSLQQAQAMQRHQPLSNSSGTVLDPILCLRPTVSLAAGKQVKVAFWTLLAGSRDELLQLITQHNEYSAFERAATLAWTLAQVQLRYLAITVAEAALFQRLTGPLLHNDSRFRSPPAAIRRGAGLQSGIWQHGISGDLPVLLLHIDDIEDIDSVRQLLRAHEYWHLKQLPVDLVIINERASSYVQDLQQAIEALVRSSRSRPTPQTASGPQTANGPQLTRGNVYTLRADLISVASRSLLAAIARVVLYARRGTLQRQLQRLAPLPVAMPARALPQTTAPASPLQPAAVVSEVNAGVVTHSVVKNSATGNSDSSDNQYIAYVSSELEFFNGLGGFANNGREYVTLLNDNQRTPMPWLNVIANPQFGFQVSAGGSGYSWAQSSRENQLTPWSNDPVTDPCAEAIYVQDMASGQLFTATSAPVNDGGHYSACHGFGYSRFQHQAAGLQLSLLQYVPLQQPVKISRLTLCNTSDKHRQLQVTAYAEWVLGRDRAACAPYLISEFEHEAAVLLVQNPWQTAFAGKVAFAALGANTPLSGWTADRTEFLGRNRSTQSPQALVQQQELSAAVGAALDPCAALQHSVSLAPGEQIELVFLLGQTDDKAGALALVQQYRAADLAAELQQVQQHWQRLLQAVQVTTPDRAMDIMLNGWLLYQTIACRIYARAAFYQASGAYGFRDQLQDTMALSFAAPGLTRAHLLRAAQRQFVEGDVQHWWLPHSGQGVRGRISDDRVWLAFACVRYLDTSGDNAVLDESVSFLQGPQLEPGQHDAFFQPMPTDAAAPLYEHCARGLDQAISLSSERGLPLIGSGDWNDGMDQVGSAGKGESIWLGWLLLATLRRFIPLAQTRGDPRADVWQHHSDMLLSAMEHYGWDDNWYKRATYDDGSWLGSQHSDECQLDSLSQSWAVLSGMADPQRAATAMAAVEQHLVQRRQQLLLLFTPPFDTGTHNPGYIKGYPPGLRENGGQYSHAAMWVVMAFAKLGQADQAQQLFSMLNPLNHALTPAGVSRYKLEPYVVAADVYSVAPHIGRGGWSWYTGAAGWMYRAGVESLLGLTRHGSHIHLAPCLPPHWPGFSANVTIGNSKYALQINQQANPVPQQATLTLDGDEVSADSAIFISANCIALALDDKPHQLSWNKRSA